MVYKYKSESKMDAKLKAKWLKALRSGKYKQTPGVLESVNIEGGVITTTGNCCLGVLCRVLDLPAKPDGISGFCEIKFDNGTNYLSDSLLKQIGLTDTDQKHLAGMNDGEIERELAKTNKKHTFKTIANWIEKNIPPVKKVKKAA